MILVLDPGGYGPITITNAVSIINDGVGPSGVFSLNPSTNNALDIDLTDNGRVLLKGLTIDGGAKVGNGVSMTSGGRLIVDHCVVTGFVSNNSTTGNGIYVHPLSGTASFHVGDSLVAFNDRVGVWAVPVFPAASGSSNVEGTIRNVTISNSVFGVVVNTSRTTGTGKVTIEDSLVTKNTNGVFSETGARSTIRLNRVQATANSTDVRNDTGGTLITLGNNLYDTSQGTFTSNALR